MRTQKREEREPLITKIKFSQLEEYVSNMIKGLYMPA
jgi:hypothetical protein